MAQAASRCAHTANVFRSLRSGAENLRRRIGVSDCITRSMPRRPTHVAAGLTAGLGAGIVSARDLPHDEQPLHVVFAALGGVIGGLAPDWLEPGTNPSHRNLFHSLFAAGGITSAILADLRSSCSQAAAACQCRAELFPIGSTQRSNELLKALIWRAIAGLVIGFLAGYASHLALDAGTAKSLPLLFNGF